MKPVNRMPVIRCRTCGRVFAIPVYLCGNCGQATLDEFLIDGNGKMLSYTVIRVPPLGFENQAPYTVAFIEVEKGLKVTARLLNDPASNAAKIPSSVRFVERKDGCYWFELETGTTS